MASSSLIFYGYGSKRNVINLFAKKLEGETIVVEGGNENVDAEAIVALVERILTNKTSKPKDNNLIGEGGSEATAKALFRLPTLRTSFYSSLILPLFAIRLAHRSASKLHHPRAKRRHHRRTNEADEVRESRRLSPFHVHQINKFDHPFLRRPSDEGAQDVGGHLCPKSRRSKSCRKRRQRQRPRCS